MGWMIDGRNGRLPPRDVWPWSCAFCKHYRRGEVCEYYTAHDCKGSRDWLHNVAQAPVAQRQAVPPKFLAKKEA